MRLSELARQRLLLSLLVLLPLAAGAGCNCGAPPVTVHLPPVLPAFSGTPVVLVTIDTLRADRVGCFAPDDPYISTPNLDALAARGRIFTQCYTTVPLTLPAHASILTGLFPAAHRIRDNVNYRLPAGATTIAEVFRDAGYDTAAFVSAPTVAGGLGLAQGFDVYNDDLQLRSGGGVLLAERRSDETVARAIEWLTSVCDAASRAPADAPARPFFLWVHMFDPHLPYNAPTDYRPRDRIRPPVQLPGESLATARHKAQYDAEVSFADHSLGTLLAFLESKQLRDTTAMLVTSDHGESLGQHGEATHGYTCYPPTLHVPLIVAAPGVAAGGRSDAVVSVTAIAPTLATLAGVTESSLAAQSDSLPMRDADAVPQTWPSFEAFLGTLNFGWAPVRGAISPTDRQAILWSNPPEAYAGADDAMWERNLWSDTDRERWHTQLSQLLTSRAEAATGIGNPVVPPRTTRDTGIDLASYPGAPTGAADGGNALDSVLATTFPAQLFSASLDAPELFAERRSPAAHREDLIAYQNAQRDTAAGKYPLAIKTADELLQRDPRNAPALLLQTECWRLYAAEQLTNDPAQAQSMYAHAADTYARYVDVMLAAGHRWNPAVAQALHESLAVRRFFAGDRAGAETALKEVPPAELGADGRLVLALCWHYRGASAAAQLVIEDAGDAASPALKQLGAMLAAGTASADLAVLNPQFGFPPFR